MPYQVIPRELAFFDLLDQAAEGTARAAIVLRELVDELGSPTERTGVIRDLEHAGDDLTHRIAALLNITFVTPVDRQDIHELASHLDDVLDAVDEVAEMLVLYRIEEPLPQFRLQVDVLVGATNAVARAVAGLRSMTPTPRIMTEIVRLERDGDHVYRNAVAALFAGDFKAMEVLKWKDILDEMEEAIDRCEDVANAVESISLKYA
ncbi:MAG: DUF47 domain-containing protein [Solirubrobacterales bacterium]